MKSSTNPQFEKFKRAEGLRRYIKARREEDKLIMRVIGELTGLSRANCHDIYRRHKKAHYVFRDGRAIMVTKPSKKEVANKRLYEEYKATYDELIAAKPCQHKRIIADTARMEIRCADCREELPDFRINSHQRQ